MYLWAIDFSGLHRKMLRTFSTFLRSFTIGEGGGGGGGGGVTPQPGTRWGVKQGCHTSGLGLFNLFFLRADTCTCFLIHMHNFCNNKILLHIHYKYHHSGIHVLYTESHYFSIYKTYTYSKNTKISEAVR